MSDDRPAHPDFEALAEILDDLDEPVVYRCDTEPHPATRRLMATLGVEVVVTERGGAGMTVAQDVVVTRCPHAGCSWTWVGTALRGKAAIPTHLKLMHGGVDPRTNGEAPPLAEPDQGRGGIPVSEQVLESRSELSGSASGRRTNATPWTRETAIEAVRRFARDHDGRPPVSTETVGNGLPNVGAARRLFGTFAGMIEAAGFPKPTRGGRKPGREPKAPAAGTAEAGEPLASPTKPPRAQSPVASPAKPVGAKRGSRPVAIALRDPIRTADIPYDADVLEDEVAFLRARADALEQIASGIRRLAAL